MRTCALRIDLKFEMCLSHRKHQMFNNRYNPKGYTRLRVTPIVCGLEAPKWHGKKQLFIHLHSFHSSIRNYQQ